LAIKGYVQTGVSSPVLGICYKFIAKSPFIVVPLQNKETTPDPLVKPKNKECAMLSQPAGARDTALLERLRAAAKKGVSAAELHSQRVSFIVSSVSDERTKVTSQMVEEELSKLNGNAA
jgi:hypothetical protein